MPDHQLEINPTGAGPIAIPPNEFWDLVLNAIDLASDRDTRTRITDGGKVIAWIVTAEDGERLERLDHPRTFGDLSEAERKALTRRAMAQLNRELSTPQFAAALSGILDEPDPAETTCEQCGNRLVAGEGDGNFCGPCTETGEAELTAELSEPDTLRELREPE